jgi:hypothetical protein
MNWKDFRKKLWPNLLSQHLPAGTEDNYWYQYWNEKVPCPTHTTDIYWFLFLIIMYEAGWTPELFLIVAKIQFCIWGLLSL